ncbi:hypothetical protein [Blastococcus saxobsidens]|uniref:Uncharacterized protein n=1 Tax=Blastococcus saxobsidens (strain DD2) TaxID=1146883 RepID=H6RML3_BLASD|nr:hypothetical protein [Blastococcus saxobsidens]CCG03848.1 conserved protein of unknown function [Blastococcus saxobsidens DD2]
MFDIDWMGLLTREVLRERGAALIAETCAWAVGLSDRPHYRRHSGRLAPSGLTVGERAANGQPLGDEEDGRVDLGDARPGSFQDALAMVGPDGRLEAERFDDEVLVPFVAETCRLAGERGRTTRRADWAELADDLGEDPVDVADVVRAGGWEAPLRIDAEHLVLAALGHVPLIEVEAEGLPLSLVRAAEAAARAAVPAPAPEPDDSLAGALFLARAALEDSGCSVPVPPEESDLLLAALGEAGLEPDEVTSVVPHLPVEESTITRIAATLPGGQDGPTDGDRPRSVG